MDNKPINERIRYFARANRLSMKSLAEVVGADNAYFTRSVVGTYNAEYIAKLFIAFPNLSPDWIMNGIGEMYRHVEAIELNGDSCQDNNEPTENVETNDDFSEIGEVEDYQAMSYHRNAPDYVDKLLDLLKTKDAQISTLLEMLNRK